MPLAAPVALGANRTVKDVLCPAFSVTGNVSPLKLNPVPLADAAETVSALPPVLVNVSERLLLLPTCTLPNERLVGFADTVPGVTPVPDRGMLRLGFDPVEVMLMSPLATPAAMGANRAVNVVLCPAFNVIGTARPLRLKPLPAAVAAEMVRAVPPEFVSVPESDFELPVCTVPKLKLEGFGAS